MKLLSAITVATVKATVVKKPKTFCSRTSAECMVRDVRSSVQRGVSRWHVRVESRRLGGPNTYLELGRRSEPSPTNGWRDRA